MPQTHFTLGEALGKAIGGGFSNQSYDQGLTAGIKGQNAIADTRKAQAEADLKCQEFEYKTPDSLHKIGMMKAGINNDLAGRLQHYFNTGKTDINNGALIETDEPQIGVAEAAQIPDINPTLFKGQAERARDVIASLMQSLAVGDTNSVHASQDRFAQQQSRGAGTPESLAAQLQLHGKSPIDAGTYGTTNLLDGAFKVNEVGRSQITENIAQAGNANASARKTAREVEKAPSDEYKAVRDDIRADYNAEYPIDRYTGQRPKGAVSYEDYTKGWIKKHGIDEKNFFNAGNPIVTPAETQMAPDPFAPPAQRFSNDPAMKGNKAGKMVDGKGIEVFNASGKLIGYYK